mmetsp:Transcript_64149/g.171082  ORF Transcript_64149/g.171082 Transcript_64149/m.171082 type:complete len:101 (+) Transcript_64149:594-896(+)|eukprot:4378272-Prymnesium_polylepis.1
MNVLDSLILTNLSMWVAVKATLSVRPVERTLEHLVGRLARREGSAIILAHEPLVAKELPAERPKGGWIDALSARSLHFAHFSEVVTTAPVESQSGMGGGS